MASIDMPLEQLKKYKPALTKKKDFASFWQRTLAETRKFPLKPELRSVKENALLHMEIYDISFSGFGGQRIKGWYLLPKFLKKKNLPVIVIYHGYSGGRGVPEDYSPWILLGCAVAVLDTRGQGGDTGNLMGYSSPAVSGWMTRGILDKKEYYYRALFSDAVRLIDFVCSRPEIDKKRIAVTGVSQGGGITIAAAGLDKRIALAMPDIPFLCDFVRATSICPGYPYMEITDFLRKYPAYESKVFDTLSYFDGINLAKSIKARSLWSVGLWDDCCPPSTGFAAFNHAAGKKEIKVFTYHRHEIIVPFQQEKYRFVRKHFSLK